MGEIINSQDRVAFREKILGAQDFLAEKIASGAAQDAMPSLKLSHSFSPIHAEYGCCTYARQMFIPKGTVIIGKIHRHAHHNFILKGKVSVATEFGKKYFEAPCSFVSEVGLKRAVYAEEDTIWVTVHLTKFSGEENLDVIEDELIASDYAALGLVSSVRELKRVAP